MSNYFPGKYLYESITLACKPLPLWKQSGHSGASLALHQANSHSMVLSLSLNTVCLSFPCNWAPGFHTCSLIVYSQQSSQSDPLNTCLITSLFYSKSS